MQFYEQDALLPLLGYATYSIFLKVSKEKHTATEKASWEDFTWANVIKTAGI